MKDGIKLSIIGQPTEHNYIFTMQELSTQYTMAYGESALEEFNNAVVINVEKKLLEEMVRTNNAEYEVSKLKEVVKVLYSALMKIEEQEDLAEEICGVDRKYSRLIQKHLEAAEDALGENGNLKDYV